MDLCLTAAMLVYPDFFKAAVSSAGNHDNNVYNSWWSETHHGVKEEIDEKGKIFMFIKLMTINLCEKPKRTFNVDSWRYG